MSYLTGGDPIRTLTLTATLAALLIPTAQASSRPVPLLTGTITHTDAGTYRLGKWSPGVGNALNAIYKTWCGAYKRCTAGDDALRVADCETGGTFSVWALNGQYQGLFQMGEFARGRYGHSVGPWGQARAAHRYFRDAGSDWSPWACKP